MNTGLQAIIDAHRDEIETLLNSAGDLREEASEIEFEERYVSAVDARNGRVRLAEIGREIKAIEVRLLRVYADLSYAEQEQAILVNRGEQWKRLTGLVTA